MSRYEESIIRDQIHKNKEKIIGLEDEIFPLRQLLYSLQEANEVFKSELYILQRTRLAPVGKMKKGWILRTIQASLGCSPWKARQVLAEIKTKEKENDPTNPD